MDKQIDIQVIGKCAVSNYCKEVVCGNSDYTVKFDFSEADESFTKYNDKTALFVYGKNTTPVIFQGDTCPMPPLSNCTECLIGLIAGNVHTTTAVKVRCFPSISDFGGTIAPPTEDVYNQIMEILNRLDPETAITEEEINQIIAEATSALESRIEELENKVTGGGLTEDEVKEIVSEETKNLSGVKVSNEFVKEFDADTKLDKVTSTSGFERVYGIGTDGSQKIINTSVNPAGSGTLVKYYGSGKLKAEDGAEKTEVVNYRQLKANAIDPIADHEKRIENLESTLLTYIEDSTSAYQKVVPVGAATNAVLSNISGVTKTSDNWLDPSLFTGTSVGEDGSIRVSYDFGDNPFYSEYHATVTLPEGTYYLKTNSTVISGENAIVHDASFENAYLEKTEISLTEETKVRIEFWIEGGGLVEADVYVMLSTDPNAEFEPYGFERYGAVTKVISKDVNIFNFEGLKAMRADSSKNITVDYDNQTISIASGASGYIYFASFEDFANCTGIDSDGDYTLRCDSTNVNHAVWRVYTDGKETFRFNGYWGSSTGFTVTEEQINTIKNGRTIGFLLYGGTESASDPSITIASNIQINRGLAALPYKPYNAEPIDTFEIPSQIQAVNGYGKEGFVLDLVNKTTTYNGTVEDVSAYLDYPKYKTIKVEGGGVLEFVNEYKLAIPSTVTYVKKKE